jgi:muconolactone delta-isomerase
MKILAVEKEVAGVADEAFAPHLEAEARRAWELHQQGLIRELYFRQDWPGAVLMLECRDVDEARDVLATLPLVKTGLIDFDVMPLVAYPGFARLFKPEPQAS